ncbi:MAG: copper resistance protein NlpE N-terminal domain-containing protein [Luteimonas sp.]
MNTVVLPRIALLAVALALAGCQRQAPVPANRAVARALETDGQIRWRGRASCVDCDGIDAQLTLHRAGRLHEFTLVETFYSGQRGIRFVDHGRWRQSGGLVRLQGNRGSTRSYALLPDGRLQATGTHGAPLTPDSAALVPVSASQAP